ncbi:MAG TPA: hypothetical protein PK079_09250 [Leptospiraceae bacterium]|nr:hypothetical protein [Leptospiraceae bacterium]HMW06403.1 hypothetical protein [Leptospiraceae bacterium]HMX31685.1 hypothetical protein [Leptospiraceae bacterium]HMY31971.1 hypothetical protein [Leptospiraceae bacterium]HMZ63165.1 hypothetical protein [Leptospiraceae bacterium]
MLFHKFKIIFLFLICLNSIFSDELIERKEAYVLSESSWFEVKEQERQEFLKTKRERKELRKQTENQIAESEKTSKRYVSFNGDIYVNKHYKPQVVNEFKGKVFIKIDDEPEQLLTPNINIYKQGIHTIVYNLYDESDVLRSTKKESIYLDTTIPELYAQLQGVYYERNQFYYYKPGFKLLLQTKDKESGIEEIFIDLNRKGYLPLSKLDQPIDSPGHKEIRIIAMDKVGNLSQEIHLNFTVDSDPPIVSVELDTIPENHSSKGLLCDRETLIWLNAFDLGSGVHKIEFRKKGTLNWRVYRDYPLVSVKKKKISLEFRSIDNLGNQSAIKYFKCRLKNE